MLIVCDSSPLIALALADKLSLLDSLYGDICIPQGVYEEITEPNKPESLKLKTWSVGKVFEVQRIDILKNFQKELDYGESEALTLYV
jgi:predicted nucleic acid-binding protein